MKLTPSKIIITFLFYAVPFIIGRFVGLGAFVLIPLIPSYWLAHAIILFIPSGSGRFFLGGTYNVIASCFNLLIYYLIACLLVSIFNKLKARKAMWWIIGKN